jgi:hypothetical protein
MLACWLCGSQDVRVTFAGYRRVYCLKGCGENHVHHSDVPQADMLCLSCNNSWCDGSGEFAPPTN